MSTIPNTARLILLMSLCLPFMSRAQLFTPESFGGAALGAGAGAIIGNQFDGQSGEGAVIGAAAGYVIGRVVGNNRANKEEEAYYSQPAPAYYPYNDANFYNPQPGYYYHPAGTQTGYYGDPSPAPKSRRVHRALTGAALGAGAGAIIGNQYDGQSGEGALIGAGIGLLLGSWSERHARRKEAERLAARPIPLRLLPLPVLQSDPYTSQAPPAQSQPAYVPKPESSMSQANQLFGR